VKRAKTHYLKSVGESGAAMSLCGMFNTQCAQDMELVTCRLCIVELREPVPESIVYPRPAPQHMQRTGCRTELRIDREILERARWSTWHTALLQLEQWRLDGYPVKSPSDPGRFEAVSIGKAEADGDRAQRIAGEFAIVAKLRDSAYQQPWVIQDTPRQEISAADCVHILVLVVAGRPRTGGKGHEQIDPVEVAAMVTEACGFEVTRTDVTRIARQGGATIEEGLHARGLVSHRDLRLQVEDMVELKLPFDVDGWDEIAAALKMSVSAARRLAVRDEDPLPVKTLHGRVRAKKVDLEAWYEREHERAA